MFSDTADVTSYYQASVGRTPEKKIFENLNFGEKLDQMSVT